MASKMLPSIKLIELKHQGVAAGESTLQKLKSTEEIREHLKKIINTVSNQGVARKCPEYHLRGSFFGTFLDKQKSTVQQSVT